MREPNNLDNKSGNDLTKQRIEFLGGRPNRDKIIGEGDFANLKIALNTAKTLDEFLEVV